MSTALTHEEQLAIPSDDRGWTEEEAFERLEHDPTSLEGPNCPWDGRALVVTTKTYGTARHGRGARIMSIGWRCKKCGNKWGWRKWWTPRG